MHPTLYKSPDLPFLGILRFHAYPTMLAIAFITCTLLAVREANRGERAFPATPQGGLWAFVGALIGAKAFWILQFSEAKYLWRALYIWEGGLVYYGGLIGGVLGVAAYLRFNRFPYWRTADIAAPYLALGEAITRIGCFLNGCCWGSVAANCPWAVQFPRNSYPFHLEVEKGLIEPSAQASLPLHPTQIYMIVGLVAATLLLKLFLNRKPPFDGAVGLGYLFLYGIVRFTVEIFRGDSERSVFGMTVSQAISLALILGSLTVFAAIMAGRPKMADVSGGAGEETPGTIPERTGEDGE